MRPAKISRKGEHMQSTAQMLKEWKQKWSASLNANAKAGNQAAEALLELVAIFQTPNETPPKPAKKGKH